MIMVGIIASIEAGPLEVLQRSAVVQLVQVHDRAARVLFRQQDHDVAADEARAARHQDAAGRVAAAAALLRRCARAHFPINLFLSTQQ